ncbi:GntR family transcriptional regulator [Streptomyces mirabilis]|uniref:GntR family transcriptional regulator n=1 Tax=Streptomyces mirabilis TaxID=68239 RepID=UPI0034310A55
MRGGTLKVGVPACGTMPIAKSMEADVPDVGPRTSGGMSVGTWLDNLAPIPREAGEHAANAAHTYLRTLVLNGTVPPHAELNQVELAERLGISRTPVREAVRMLQEEGLVEAEPYKRARVIGFEAAQFEFVYVQRILLEGLAVRLTVPLMSDEDRGAVQALAADLARMSNDAGQTPEWNDTHNRFHLALVAGAGPQVLRSIEGHMQRAEHYRLQYQYRGPRASLRHLGEHERIAELCQARDAMGAASELAAHLARTALSMIGELAPRYDPAAVREALGLFHAPGVI